MAALEEQKYLHANSLRELRLPDGHDRGRWTQRQNHPLCPPASLHPHPIPVVCELCMLSTSGDREKEDTV